MPNPILEQANNIRSQTVMNSNPMEQLKPQINQFKQQLRQIQAMSNPQMALNQLLINNPQLGNVINLIKQSGQSPQAFFYALAQQRGINPEDIIKEFQS